MDVVVDVWVDHIFALLLPPMFIGVRFLEVWTGNIGFMKRLAIFCCGTTSWITMIVEVAAWHEPYA